MIATKGTEDPKQFHRQILDSSMLGGMTSVSSAPNKGVLAERANAEFKFVTKLVGPGAIKNRGQRPRLESVSYTHLTLPTNREV